MQITENILKLPGELALKMISAKTKKRKKTAHKNTNTDKFL